MWMGHAAPLYPVKSSVNITRVKLSRVEGPRHQLGESVGAVADRLLLRRIDFRIGQTLPGRNEHGIVTAAQLAARRPGEDPRRPALDRSDESPVGERSVRSLKSRVSP